MRRTYAKLMIPIPPALARLIATGVMLGLQSFAVAYKEHAAKAAVQHETSSHNQTLRMQPPEALQILGLKDSLGVPLRQGSPEAVAAQAAFKTLFGKAKHLDNLYLMGKISAAYRVCLDETWDN